MVTLARVRTKGKNFLNLGIGKDRPQKIPLQFRPCIIVSMFILSKPSWKDHKAQIYRHNESAQETTK